MKKYFRVRPDFLLYNELRQLVLKSWLLVGSSLARDIEKIGDLERVILAGRFIGNTDSLTDILIIGTVHRDKLEKFVKQAEKQIGDEVTYTVLSPSEYAERKAVMDKFLYSMLESEHVVVYEKKDGAHE